MSEIARLREAIQARKFKSMELAGEIDRKMRELRDQMAAWPLVKIKDLKLRLIAQLAGEAADLQKEYLQQQKEIAQAEEELG